MVTRSLALCLALAICASAVAVADVSPALVAAADTTTNFGTPPSGAVPILYNDHTVYAKPDTLKQGRVLAALVKDGQIYVPLQSMFEAMGATVSVSGDTYTVTRGDTSASVTLGKNEVVVERRQSRPLDVPPILYQGVVLVPVRVLSEALGAYVEWEPTRQTRRRSVYSADAATDCAADRTADAGTNRSRRRPHPCRRRRRTPSSCKARPRGAPVTTTSSSPARSASRGR